MELTLLTNITVQDNFDEVLSSPLGTENIPSVRPPSEPAPPEANTAAPSQAANQQPVKTVPIWVYFSVVSAAVMSVAYWFKLVA